jgi:hypothetical protein
LAGVDASELDNDRHIRADHDPVVDAEGHRLGVDQIVEAHAAHPAGSDGETIRTSRIAVGVVDSELHMCLAVARIQQKELISAGEFRLWPCAP